MDTKLRARIGGLARSAKYPGLEVTAAARQTFRESFARQVDPEGTLPEAERARRGEAARKLHYARMAFVSAKVREKKTASTRSFAETVRPGGETGGASTNLETSV